MKTEKNELRAILKNAYSAMGELYILSADSVIRESLFNMPEYKDARTIYTYCSVDREVDTRHIIERALSDGKTVALPVITGLGTMAARKLSSLNDLTPGEYGIPVPPANEPVLTDDDIDIVLVPGLAFDQGGFRIGRGGGFYDRLLAVSGAYAIGLVREQMVYTELPREKQDKAVDCLITEKSVARLR